MKHNPFFSSSLPSTLTWSSTSSWWFHEVEVLQSGKPPPKLRAVSVPMDIKILSVNLRATLNNKAYHQLRCLRARMVRKLKHHEQK